MRAGDLRFRVTITATKEEKTEQFGFEAKELIIAKRAAADVSSLEGIELERAQQIAPRATHLVRIRYRLGVLAGQTVIYHDGQAGDRPFEIVAPPVDVDMRHVELRLLCREAA